MNAGAWRIALGIASVAVLTAAAPAERAPVQAVAAEIPGGARLVLRWPATRTGGPPQVVASAEGAAIVLRSAEPMAIDLSRLAGEAPAAIKTAALSEDGRVLRVELRRPMRPSVETFDTGYAVTLQVPPEPAAAIATVSAAETEGFTRLSFRFPQPTTVTPLQRGDRLDLRFARAAEIDIAPVSIAPPRFLKSIRVASRPGERLALALELSPGVRQRHFVDGGQTVVDLLAPSATPPPPPPKPVAANPVPAGGSVNVVAAEAADATTLTLRWAGPVRAAAFRRGEAIWLLFDANARLSLNGVPKVGRRHTDIAEVRAEGLAGLRIAAPATVQVTARASGPTWTFTLADRADRPADAQLAPLREQAAAGVRLLVPFGRDGVVRVVDDPVVGDRFIAGLIPPPTLGVSTRRATLEATIQPTAHGALAETRADGVGAVFEAGAFAISRGQGLIAATATQRGAVEPDLDPGADAAVSAYAMLDLEGWSDAAQKRPRDMIDELEARAAAEGMEAGQSTTARIALARFLLGLELAPEALGALRIAALNQPQLEVDPEFRLMRAAASLMMGRLADARKDLSASGLAQDPSAALWRAYAAAQEEKWGEARASFEAGRGALATQPPGWRARFHLAAGEAALRLGDAPAAAAAAAAALSAANANDLRAQAQVLEARIARARGESVRALQLFDQLSRSRDEASAVRAALEAVRLRRELKQIKAEEAAEILDGLRFRWRGDGLELEIIQQLAFVYADMGRWRDGLGLMRQAALRFGEHPAARRLRLDMAEMFERLYLDGGADVLEPIPALGLFYDFRDLTPYGPDGDRMIRLLAGRLASMDLMEQAAELLQHQVDERLEGVGQAQIAADLAALYLDDNHPERALAALQSTRQPGMPADLVAERRILEATALLRLGRFDHAVELVEKDKSPEAQRVRAEAAWRRKDWPAAIVALQAALVARPPQTPLAPDDRNLALRLAIAAVFAEDRRALADVRRRYAEGMAGSPEADAFDLITDSPDPLSPDLAEAVRRVARTDLLERFMASVRARVAGRPAGPAAAAAATQPTPPPA